MWQRHFQEGAVTPTHITMPPKDIDAILEGLHAANLWMHYAQEFVDARRKLAVANLLAREGKENEALKALGLQKRGQRGPRLGDREEREVVDHYKALLSGEIPVTRFDEERIWASGVLEMGGQPGLRTRTRLLPTGGRKAFGPYKGPMKPEAAAAIVADMYPERFRSSTAVVRFLETHRAQTGDDFPLPSRRRRHSR